VGSAADGPVRELVRQRLQGWESRQREREKRREGWHEYQRVYKSASSWARDQTYEAVERQLTAMGAELFEVGALQRGEGDQPQFMLLRTWDPHSLIQSIPWLRYQNWHESHIFVRPKGESNLTLVDDLTMGALVRMRQEGFQPAAVVQTSPGNYQAWIKHHGQLNRELGTAVARALAERFDGDVKAAAWRHFGRLAGFRNTKSKYKQVVAVPEYDAWRGQNFHRDLEGQWMDRSGHVYTDEQLCRIHANVLPKTKFPFVRLVEASGAVAQGSAQVVDAVRGRAAYERYLKAVGMSLHNGSRTAIERLTGLED